MIDIARSTIVLFTLFVKVIKLTFKVNFTVMLHPPKNNFFYFSLIMQVIEIMMLSLPEITQAAL